SCLPSVLTSSSVSGSILSRSRIGRSITNAKLFPCFVSFFTTLSSVLPMYHHWRMPARRGTVQRERQELERSTPGGRCWPPWIRTLVNRFCIQNTFFLFCLTRFASLPESSSCPRRCCSREGSRAS